MFGIVNLGACPCAGEKWKSRRKLIAPEFRPSNLESSVKILSSNTDNLLDRLATFVDGPEFDVHYFMNLHSLDNVWGECRPPRFVPPDIFTKSFLPNYLS